MSICGLASLSTENKLQEVDRIHARKILDEDIINAKKLQDMLFKDRRRER
jgi:hypothetical protein